MKSKLLFTTLLCTTMVFGCKKEEEAKPTPAPEVTKTVEAEKTPEVVPEVAARPELPPFAAVIIHKVADFDKWKTGFDAHADARKGAGILGHHLSRGTDDANMVYVYLPMAATEKFTEMLASEDMKKAMKESGVEGEPTVIMIKPVDGAAVTDREIPGAVIMHKVADFAAWKTAFDAHAGDRAKAGIIGHAVNHVVDDENQVMVLIQAETADELSAFLGSEELKAAMVSAGVEGEPTITMLNSIPGAMY